MISSQTSPAPAIIQPMPSILCIIISLPVEVLKGCSPANTQPGGGGCKGRHGQALREPTNQTTSGGSTTHCRTGARPTPRTGTSGISAA